MTLRVLLGLLVGLTLVLAGCADPDVVATGPPVGDPVLPDLMPDPPAEVRTRPEEDGRVLLLFTSTLANVGAGDFILKGERVAGNWLVHQEIVYSDSGVDVSEVAAEMVWGGDGHNHWHVSRAAVYWLEALDTNGEPISDFARRYDSKVGFCFFDSHQVLDYGPDELVYLEEGCAHEGDTDFRMGMSRGWSDVYPFFLPGQEVDITDVPDGSYRLWAQADPQGWFMESDATNNKTWVDIDLSTRESDGARLALVVNIGPRPGGA